MVATRSIVPVNRRSPRHPPLRAGEPDARESPPPRVTMTIMSPLRRHRQHPAGTYPGDVGLLLGTGRCRGRLGPVAHGVPRVARRPAGSVRCPASDSLSWRGDRGRAAWAAHKRSSSRRARRASCPSLTAIGALGGPLTPRIIIHMMAPIPTGRLAGKPSTSDCMISPGIEEMPSHALYLLST